MTPRRGFRPISVARVAALSMLISVSAFPEDVPRPVITDIALENSRKIIRFTPFPAANEFKVLRADKVDGEYAVEAGGTFSGYDWISSISAADTLGFYKLRVTTLSEEALLTATLLNRLAYGPTPDELERVNAIGPRAYVEEQLAPEKIVEPVDVADRAGPPVWQYYTFTGTASSALLYVALTSAGEAYIDDVKLVVGTVAEAGSNLVRNGDFELALSTNDWMLSPNLAASRITAAASHSGKSCLHLVATSAGTTLSSSLWQTNVPGLSVGSTRRYTLSYWYRPANDPADVIVRLAGDGVISSTSRLVSWNRLAAGSAGLRELQAWSIRHAVRSKRQLFEVLTHFFDNHFTTYTPKSQEYVLGKAKAGTEESIATNFEYRELIKWRDVLLNPNGTFYDLLKISAESPAMVIYLDTVTSKNGAANENYARELMELFTMGVDNGYDQQDIEEMSRAWTGWQVDKLIPGQEDNPFARPISNPVARAGYWSLRFRGDYHDVEPKTIFPAKTIAARFGSPHAGKSYQLELPARAGESGMQDGYDIIAHLADLPYTQEYISVKLCRLFVHERFAHGVYDYTLPELSPEAALVRDCMRAWDTPAGDGRKGNVRQVVGVILNSPLLRQHAASQQKVRSPFKFVVSTVRALRAAKPDGEFTSQSGGSDLIDPMARLGMSLFNREQPDGWSEFGADWINSSSLIERMRFVQNRLHVGTYTADPVGLLELKLPAVRWSEAPTVVDYFLSILFPAEGKANLDLDRTTALTFLNTLDDGVTPSPFSELSPDSDTYEARVRGMVAFLMGLPRFQEQ
ncbi:MAG: DUF1800 domain-containing protein [Verrucomicrobiales bacterium]|nr:DUF1800 domain-containing protein [Verrucomicrobiales bacterium]